MKKIFLIYLFSFLLLPFLVISQGEWNKWYFGSHAALDFNSGSPIALTNSAMNADKTNTTISDSLGNLLFYANDHEVYNRDHTIMPNGSGLLGAGMAAQNVLAVPKPGEDSIYYIFTVGDGNPLYPLIGLHYSVIDMRLDGGLGDIIPLQKNISIPSATDAFQQLTAIRHHNNQDIWLVVRKHGSMNDQYASYLITNSGIESIPVLSVSLRYGCVVNAGIMRISPDGTKLICTPDSVTEFCSFNTSTGTILPLFTFQPNQQPFHTIHGAEFSIDSRFIYCASVGYGNDSMPVLQYNADLIDSSGFVQSETLIGYGGLQDIQMGPDWKIYCAPNEEPGFFNYYLHVIENSTVQGTGCNFQRNAVSLAGRRAVGSLPQFLQRYHAYINHSGSCQYNPVFFNGTIWPPPDSASWNFGDPASGALNFSNDYPAFHTFNLPGDYYVTMIVRHIDKRFDTAYTTIHIEQTYNPQLGQDQTICAGDSITFDAGACVGCTYLWADYLADTIVSTSQTFKTGSPGIYTVKVTNTFGCKGFDTIQLFVTAPPIVTTSPLSKFICSGDSTRIALSANVAGTTFSWSVTGSSLLVSGFLPGTGDTINQKLVSTSTVDETVTYWITPHAGNCAGDSVAYVVTIQPGDSVSVSIAASQNPVCEGTLVTFTASPINGGIAPVYQWYINGVLMGTNSPVFTYVPVTSDQVTCDLTSSETVCITNNPALSNTITMTVNPNIPVSVIISPSLNPVCSGVSVSFTAFPQYGGTSPTYQWQVNGINAGTNNSVFTYTPVNNDIVTCILTSSESVCVTNNPATSNQIIMTVNPNLPVSVTISPSANPVCAGTSVTFTATPVNGGIAPVYQWYINGLLTGINSPMFTYVPVTSDQVTCDLTSSETVCVTNNPATSNTIIMAVNPNLPVSVSIVASQNPVCSGTSVTFTATPVNEGTTPSYQWKVNGINVGTNNPVFTYVPVNGEAVSCELLSSETVCVSNNPATSNTITMTVNPNLPVSVSIAASANPVCEGTSVTFTATPLNGGMSPVYQWYINGVLVGTNSPVFTYDPGSSDLVSCILTSNLTCATGNPATSNTIVMNVVAKPVVSLTACFDTITTVNAKPIKLKGGIPLGGTYSGAGVNAGIFYPALAGPGTHVITYTYTNAGSCSDNAQLSIVNCISSFVNCGLPITDVRDGKVYPTVQIGTQCWLAANLNYGAQVPSAQYQRDNCTPEKYCYNDLPANCLLGTANSSYQWDELMSYDATPGNQGLCPPAWHVPTEADWNTLFAVYINNAFAGSPLKYSGYSGFNALLSGAKHFNKAWNYAGFAAFFWSSTPWGTEKAWAHGMNDPDPSVSRYPSYRANAFSVRCIRD